MCLCREPGQQQGGGNIAGDLRSKNRHQNFPAGQKLLQPAGKGRNAPQIANEDEKSHKGQKQGIVHRPQGARVCKKNADEYSGKGDAIGQHPDHGQQADGKQNQIQQDDLLIPLRGRGRNKLVHGEGDRGFPADQRCPSQQQEQRDQGVGQHKKHKSPDAHATFSVKIEVLWVADGGQHTAKVCRDGLHTDHRDQKGAADIRSQTAQNHERKGNEGQQGNIVGDEHASEKAQSDQYQRQLKGAVGAGQQCPAQFIKKALPPQPGHDRHQGKQDRQRAQVDVAEILRIRRNKEGGDNGQHSGCGEDRFLLNELFEFHRDTSL